MESKQPTMDELLNRHELAFSTRFASLLSQLADEGIGFSLPVVVIEHIWNSESNLGIVKAQARKFAKELSNIVDGTNEEYFDLLKVKEVEFETEERGVLVKHKELIMILNCKEKAANYSIYHELNNRVERRLRLSAYIFDEEGCVYPDKSAKKTPLDKNKLRAMFISNPFIRNQVFIDNKGERKRRRLDSTRSRDTKVASPKKSTWVKYWCLRTIGPKWEEIVLSIRSKADWLRKSPTNKSQQHRHKPVNKMKT